MDQSFPSLADDESLNDDSFWPSFTDILTVIVMIFLMAMLVLLLRNMDLIARLQDTIQQKEQAFRQSEQIKQQNVRLSTKLQQSENQLLSLRDNQQQLTARLELEVSQRESLNTQFREQQAQMQQLQQQNADQAAQLLAQREQLVQQQEAQQRLEARYALSTEALSKATAEAAANQVALDKARQHTRELELNIIALQNTQARQQATMAQELQQWRIQAENNGRDLHQLQDDYSNLNARYLQLIRPARSPRNKHVVEVLYNDRNGQRVYGIRESQQQAWQEMPRNQLEQALSALKQQFGLNLYVRIIIPDDSPISFNEAWDFTHLMLNRYDYYYQKE